MCSSDLEGIVTSTSLTLSGSGPAVITASDLEFAVGGTIDFGGKALNSVGDGVAADDAATKGQLDTEVSARIADVDAEESRAMAAESALDGRLDIIEGADTVEGSVAKAEKDAKDYTDAREVAITSAYQAYADAAEADAVSTANAYTDAEVAALVNSAPAVLDTLKELADALGSDPNFATTVAGQIGDVAADLAQEVLDRTADVDAEESRALAAEAAIQLELDDTQVGAGLEVDGSYNPDATTNYLTAASSLKDADSLLDAEVKAVSDALAQEIADRVAGEGTIGGELDNTQLGAGLEIDGSYYQDATTNYLTAASSLKNADFILDAELKTVSDALDQEMLDRDAAIAQEVLDRDAAISAAITQEVTDRDFAISTAVANLVDGAPALLDTLNELAAAINDDENFAVTIAGQISGLDSRADALEAASVEFKPVEKFVLDATDISNGYITLSYKAIQHSLRVSVDRLAVHQGAGNDYTVSLVGGVTRITFVNSLVTPGQEKLSVGDEVYVEGAKLAIVTV